MVLMNYSYTQWKKHLMDEDVHAMAILSFPAVTQCATTVQELVQNAEMQSAVCLLYTSDAADEL